MSVQFQDNHWYIVESRPVIIDDKKKYKNHWIPISAKDKEDAKKIEDEYKDNKKKRYLHPGVESERPAVQTLEKLVSNGPKPTLKKVKPKVKNKI